MGMARPPLMPPPGMMMPPGAGMGPRPGAPPPPFMAPMPGPPPAAVMDEGPGPSILLPPAPADEEEPMSKKAKMDSLEAELIGESEFLKKNTRPITFRVAVPELPDKSEWQCQGQTLSITMPLTAQCNGIKSKIFEMIDMPAGKQKLMLGNFFIKDSNTLAYYNFSSTSVVQLQVKERGGRKK
jgi:splicing factor 3A subunit 1